LVAFNARNRLRYRGVKKYKFEARMLDPKMYPVHGEELRVRELRDLLKSRSYL